MKKLLKNILIAFVSIATIYAGVQAWTGLIAVDGDSLDYTKWNELVNKVLPIESSGGNIGIGTASPENELHVKDSADGGAYITIQNGPSSAVDSKGSIGVGTYGSGGFEIPTMLFQLNGTPGGNLMSLNSNGNLVVRNNAHIYNGDAKLHVHSDGATPAAIFNNGNVGIGTDTPTATLDVAGNINATPVIFLGKGPGNPYQIGGGNPAIWTQDINLGGFTLQNGGTEVKVPSDGYYKINAMMHLKDDPADAGWTWLWISKNGSNSTQSLYPTNSNWATHHLTNIMYLTTTDVITIPYAGTREAQQQFSKLIIEKLN